MGNIGEPGTDLTVAEAAQALGTTPTKVLLMLREGELVGRETAEGWRVDALSVSCARTRGTDRKAAAGCAAYCRSKCGRG